jgi:hypothetical protein
VLFIWRRAVVTAFARDPHMCVSVLMCARATDRNAAQVGECRGERRAPLSPVKSGLFIIKTWTRQTNLVSLSFSLAEAGDCYFFERKTE